MHYFIKRGEKVQGPFTREQLLGFAKAKKITAADLVSNSAQGPFQELKSVWESIKNPLAAPAIPEPVTQTTEPVHASPPVPMPVVQERFETPVIETGGSPTAQPEPQSVPSSLPMSAKPNGRKKLLLIGGIAGGGILLLIVVVLIALRSGANAAHAIEKAKIDNAVESMAASMERFNQGLESASVASGSVFGMLDTMDSTIGKGGGWFGKEAVDSGEQAKMHSKAADNIKQLMDAAGKASGSVAEFEASNELMINGALERTLMTNAEVDAIKGSPDQE